MTDIPWVDAVAGQFMCVANEPTFKLTVVNFKVELQCQNVVINAEPLAWRVVCGSQVDGTAWG